MASFFSIAGELHGYRVAGPSVAERGLRFDASKVLLDPYGRGVVVPKNYSRESACREGDNAATAMKSVVVDPTSTIGKATSRWVCQPCARSFTKCTWRGFTRHPSSGVGEKTRGTYAGLIEKISYLKELGVSAVELLPVFQLIGQHARQEKSIIGADAAISFFAPHQAYSSRRDSLGPVNEFRDMVKALHCAGIEVILDVVFNHTAEGNECGPTRCFRGIR